MSQMLERQQIVEVRAKLSTALAPRPSRSLPTHPRGLHIPVAIDEFLISHLQNQCSEGLHALHERLVTIEELQTQFTEYQLSYNKLVVEMGRRLQYREAAENIVRGMIDQLAAMTEGLCPIFRACLSTF